MYTEIAANKRRTLILIATFIVVLWGLGWVLSEATGSPGMIYFFGVFAVVYALISYYASAKIALAISGAKPIAKKDAPKLYRTVENLAITAGLPTPDVYIIRDPAPNAFATGRDPKHAVVAVTTGLLERLDDKELEGVIAHELAHIGNYDIRLMAIVIMLVTVIALISDLFLRMTFWGRGNRNSNAVFMLLGLAAAIIAPLIATLMKLAVSRRREYLADATGVLLTRYPEGLASALSKIAHDPHELKHANSSNAHLFISNPLKRKKSGSWFAKLFSTHPPIKDRVAKLNSMKGSV